MAGATHGQSLRSQAMMEDAPDAPLTSAAVIGDRPAGDSPILILVDDDAPLRRSLQRALERRGFEVYAADSLKAGINLAHSVKPEYAVIDLRLEDGSGIDLVRRLRELHPKVRVVILTGSGNNAPAGGPPQHRPRPY